MSDPIVTHSLTHSLYIRNTPLTHTDTSSTAVTNVAHSKLFSIPFCNIRGLSSNLNPEHQHLQSSNPHALFLTETKIKPLDPSDNSILSPYLKCPGYEVFSSFFPYGNVCSLICSDVQSSRLQQFDLVNLGFQLIWMKISLPNTSKFICILYCLPNSINHEFLFDHLSEYVYLTIYLTHSSYITSPTVRDAEAFAIVNEMSKLMLEPTRFPDRSGDKANTLDLFLTSNPDIYPNPTVDSPLSISDHCLITLQHNFVSYQDTSFSSQKVFHYSKAHWDSLPKLFCGISLAIWLL